MEASRGYLISFNATNTVTKIEVSGMLWFTLIEPEVMAIESQNLMTKVSIVYWLNITASQ